MHNKIFCNCIVLWTVLIISQETNGILTDSQNLDCKHIHCPTKCPEDSYFKTSLDEEEDAFESYEDELLGHDSYIQEMGDFEEILPLEELSNNYTGKHMLKEREKREVLMDDDIERCCDGRKCVCNMCQDVPKCTEGYVAVLILEGQGVPGNCCSIYRCVQKEPCQLGVKQSWWTTKCRKCSCFGESELCMQNCPEEDISQNCYSEYLQRPMINGALWKEGSCTSCSCEHGERRCFTPVCSKLHCKITVRFEDECCSKCLDDEPDIRTEIIPTNEQDLEEVEEEDEETVASTSETPNVSINKEQVLSGSAVGHADLSNQTQTILSVVEEIENVTTSQVLNEISSSFQSEAIHSVATTPSSLPNSTSASVSDMSSTIETNREESTLAGQHEHDFIISLNTTTTETIKPTTQNGLELSTSFIWTEKQKSTMIIEEHFSTTDEVQLASSTSVEISEEPIVQTTITPSSVTTTPSEEYILPTSINYEGNKNNSKISKISRTSSNSATSELSTGILTESTTEGVHEPSIKPVVAFPINLSTSEVSINKTPSDSAITKMISSSTKFKIPFNSVSTSASTKTSTSSQYRTTSPTSSYTTSSPFSAHDGFITISMPKESTSKSTTPEPEPLRPLLKSYGDTATAIGTSNTQNQMRIMFDEIDYVVMIGLFIGSLLCISLGLIIRHTKNRKKMYSSIPNSETSLSQTSTHTVMTV